MNGVSAKLIVWIGNPFFYNELEKCGFRVIYQPYKLGGFYTWQSILDLTGGEIPHLVLTADASVPPFLLGMENFPCLTAFYAVDTHIHSWQHIYAQAFDICLVSLKDYLPLFARRLLDSSQVWHFPPYARDELRPPVAPVEKEWDLLFVGNMHKDCVPRRFAFLDAVGRKFPGLHCTTGNFADFFPKSRLILNECSYGELNFRVFEALGMGGCLLTPDIGPALTEIFRPGAELFTYPPYDVDALLELTLRLLADEDLRVRTARAGLAALDARHRASHRARDLSQKIRSLHDPGRGRELISKRLALAPALHKNFLLPLYLHHAENVEVPFMRETFLAAAKGINLPRQGL
ncbi:MAG: glycosyltransferase [Desulfovibrio sp.]|jgi:hypothetical protein|nr:glycosyltransferase [Desulfovibrio sp.]